MKQRIVNVISLGCSKNLVDSERLMKMLQTAGFGLIHNGPIDSKAYLTVVNTCGFIGDAKEESINTILEVVQAKETGSTEKIAVMGCLSERYRKGLTDEIPQIDMIYGKTDWPKLVADLVKATQAISPYDRIITTPSHHAYLKISEGCNRFCAFCAIPLITGRHKSRPEEEIIDEVRMLVDRGVKEFNIIAQDLSSYGLDLYGKHAIARLVDSIADINGVEWIRLHYAYPSDFPEDLLDVMARRDNVCKYLDIALQHISDNILSKMRRHITADETLKLIERIRSAVPGIHIRTTLMVGFPGETDEDFNELLDFVKEQKFERMGAFAYCEEEDTYAALNYADSISSEEKQRRLDLLMTLQEEIADEHQQSKVGKTFKVIIDREEDAYYVGRTEFDSPEVDPEVLVEKSFKLKIGNFYNVKVTEALPFELIATVERQCVI